MGEAVSHTPFHHQAVFPAPNLQITEVGFFSFKEKTTLKPINGQSPDFHSRARKVAISLGFVLGSLDRTLKIESAGKLGKLRPGQGRQGSGIIKIGMKGCDERRPEGIVPVLWKFAFTPGLHFVFLLTKAQFRESANPTGQGSGKPQRIPTPAFPSEVIGNKSHGAVALQGTARIPTKGEPALSNCSTGALISFFYQHRKRSHAEVFAHECGRYRNLIPFNPQRAIPSQKTRSRRSPQSEFQPATQRREAYFLDLQFRDKLKVAEQQGCSVPVGCGRSRRKDMMGRAKIQDRFGICDSSGPTIRKGNG